MIEFDQETTKLQAVRGKSGEEPIPKIFFFKVARPSTGLADVTVKLIFQLKIASDKRRVRNRFKWRDADFRWVPSRSCFGRPNLVLLGYLITDVIVFY